MIDATELQLDEMATEELDEGDDELMQGYDRTDILEEEENGRPRRRGCEEDWRATPPRRAISRSWRATRDPRQSKDDARLVNKVEQQTDAEACMEGAPLGDVCRRCVERCAPPEHMATLRALFDALDLTRRVRDRCWCALARIRRRRADGQLAADTTLADGLCTHARLRRHLGLPLEDDRQGQEDRSAPRSSSPQQSTTVHSIDGRASLPSRSTSVRAARR